MNQVGPWLAYGRGISSAPLRTAELHLPTDRHRSQALIANARYSASHSAAASSSETLETAPRAGELLLLLLLQLLLMEELIS